MPLIHSKTYINENPDKVYKLLSEMEFFAAHINGIQEVRISANDNTKRVSDWRIVVSGTPISWREEQILNPFNRTIHFRMLDGDYAEYEGEWKVSADKVGTQLEFRFNIEWEAAGFDEDLNVSLKEKAQFAARWAVRELRKKIGSGKLLSTNNNFQSDKVFSEPIRIKNFINKTIVGFHDKLEHTSTSSPFILVIPGYGETKRDALVTSYMLAKNGFNVVRFDPTDHIGESDGHIYDFTLSNQTNDILAVLAYLKQSSQTKIAILANSLSLRSAIKAASLTDSVDLIFGVVGVVNLKKTLLSIYNEDIIGDVSEGKIKENYEVLGYLVDKAFPIDAINGKYDSLKSTIDDLQNISEKVHLFHAENDCWVDVDDLKKLFKNPEKHLHLISKSMHNLGENPQAFKNCIRQITTLSQAILNGKQVDTGGLIDPTRRELATQNRIEKERLKLYLTRNETAEVEFWDYYLTKFSVLSRVPDYKNYLTDLISNLAINNSSLLDAGCGNGYLGATIIQRRIPGVKYVAIDRSLDSLRYCEPGHSALLRDYPLDIDRTYIPMDLNEPLKFKANSFDRICSSLVLSYLISPSKALNELVRLLKPGGRIVVSSMKPSADLSQIYRNFLGACTNPEELKLARELLNEAGKIKQKEGVGHYHFFSEKELKTFFMANNLINISCALSFGGQAFIVAGEKK